jgi:hypothetical protein
MDKNISFSSLKSSYRFPLRKNKVKIPYQEALYILPPHPSQASSFTTFKRHSRHSNDIAFLVISPTGKLIPASGTLEAIYSTQKILPPAISMDGSFFPSGLL